MDRREFFKWLPLAPFAVKPAVESVGKEIKTFKEIASPPPYYDPSGGGAFIEFGLQSKPGVYDLIFHQGKAWRRIGKDRYEKMWEVSEE